jgi:hypothetical protein
MTTKTTVKLWAEVTEISESQSENLNGGYDYTSLYIGISGGVGAIQVNSGNGAQINLQPKGNAPQYRYGYYGYYGRY